MPQGTSSDLPASDRRAMARRRLAAQGLASPGGRIPRAGRGSADEPARPAYEAIVTRLGALQAQDLASARWALGVRAGGTVDDVEQCVADRRILRTWPMRGTLHWVPARDAAWMCALLTPPAIRGSAARFAQLGLTEEVMGTIRGLVETALEHTPSLTRPAAYDVLRRGGIDPDGQRGILALGRLAMLGVLCQGPAEGRQPTFVLMAEWVTAPNRPGREEAMATLARRYVVGHGPVTAYDLAWWSGQTLGFAREAIALAGDALATERVAGTDYVVAADEADAAVLDPSRSTSAARTATLLPGFDEAIIGYRDRAVLLDEPTFRRIVPGNNGVFLPTILWGEKVVGTWTRTLTARRLTVTTLPFVELPATARASIERAAADVGAFYGVDAAVAHGQVGGQ